MTTCQKSCIKMATTIDHRPFAEVSKSTFEGVYRKNVYVYWDLYRCIVCVLMDFYTDALLVYEGTLYRCIVCVRRDFIQMHCLCTKGLYTDALFVYKRTLYRCIVCVRSSSVKVLALVLVLNCRVARMLPQRMEADKVFYSNLFCLFDQRDFICLGKHAVGKF
jgi:hypothetical protein